MSSNNPVGPNLNGERSQLPNPTQSPRGSQMNKINGPNPVQRGAVPQGSGSPRISGTPSNISPNSSPKPNNAPNKLYNSNPNSPSPTNSPLTTNIQRSSSFDTQPPGPSRNYRATRKITPIILTEENALSSALAKAQEEKTTHQRTRSFENPGPVNRLSATSNKPIVIPTSSPLSASSGNLSNSLQTSTARAQNRSVTPHPNLQYVNKPQLSQSLPGSMNKMLNRPNLNTNNNPSSSSSSSNNNNNNNNSGSPGVNRSSYRIGSSSPNSPMASTNPQNATTPERNEPQRANSLRGSTKANTSEIDAAEKIYNASKRNKEFPFSAENAKKRNNIINEILQTEIQYAYDLLVIIRVFLEPMREEKILPMLELSQLFSNIELVKEASKDLYSMLSEVIREHQEYSAIGEVFVTKVEELIPIFANYGSNQRTALNTYNRLKSKKNVARFLASCKQLPDTKGLDLDTFIITPVQRICRYPLLLKELKSATPDDHPDSESLDRALESVNKLVAVVNENSREAHNLKRMKEISENLYGADNMKIIMPGRRFIHEGLLTKISSSKVERERLFLLFSDMLLWVRLASKEKLEFKGMIPVRSLWYKDISDSDTNTPNSWEIGRADSDKKWVLSAKERKTKAMWLQALEGVMEKLNRVSGFFSSVAFKINTEHTNTTRAQTGHQLKLIDIQNRLGVKDLVDPNRKFLREAPALTKYLEERYLYLFNDRLIVSKFKSGKKNTLKMTINIDSTIVAKNQSDDDLNCITIAKVGEKKNIFAFILESKQETFAWLQDLNLITKNSGNLNNNEMFDDRANTISEGKTEDKKMKSNFNESALLKLSKISVCDEDSDSDEEERVVRKNYRKWDDDSSTSNCTQCKELFTTINRRHHCRNCGHIFCGKCTAKKVNLRKLGYKKKVRVCNACSVDLG